MAFLAPISVAPLAGNQLFLRSFIGDESMTGMFEYDVQVLCKSGDIKLGDALGASMTISVPLTTGGVRHFNGLITKFSRIGQVGNFFLFRFQLHPWLWLLSRNADCRIFQNRSVVEIVKKIFRKYSVSLFDEALGDYQPREFLVQYRETDLNFVNRLLEDQGIAGHYIHDVGQHKLMLTDSSLRRDAAPGYESVVLHQPTDAGNSECFVAWNVSQEIQPAAYILKDFDYQKPKAPLASALSTPSTSDFRVAGELYDYPGNYLTNDAGNRLVGIRLEQAQTFYETFQASGPVRGVGPGNVFSLEGPLVLDPQREYLITRAHYEIHSPAPESNPGSEKNESFTCSINAVDAQIHFRPARVTPIPVVQGPQTATVVDPQKDAQNKQEIWTDDLGRVLVDFHWERLGALKPEDPERSGDDADNDKAPCWLRVAELWAGAGFGTVFTPRIGQEVMVEFLEGNPDRPIVTGRLYNHDNKPAYLNEHKSTRSGIRSHSTPGGGPKNFNELRFEDKKGEEEVYIQAEKNQLNHVKHNRTAQVDADDSVSVGGDRSVTVTGNLKVTVKGGGKSPIHSDHEVTGKHKLYAHDCIDLEAKNYIQLKVGDTFIRITRDTIMLHAVGGGEVIVTPDIEAHANGKSSLHLDGNAKLYGEGSATVTGKDSARIEGKVMTAHADDGATLEGTDVSVHGSTKVVVNGGDATITSTANGIDALGTAINLNSS